MYPATPIQAAIQPSQSVQINPLETQQVELLFPMVKQEGPLTLHIQASQEPKSWHYYPLPETKQTPRLSLNLKDFPSKAGPYSYQLRTSQGQVLQSGSLTLPTKADQDFKPRTQFSPAKLDQGLLLFQLKPAPASPAIKQARLQIRQDQQEPKFYPLSLENTAGCFQTTIDLNQELAGSPIQAQVEISFDQGQKQGYPLADYQIPLDKLKPQVQVQQEDRTLHVEISRAQTLEQAQLLLNHQAYPLQQISPALYQLSLDLPTSTVANIQLQAFQQGHEQILYHKTLQAVPSFDQPPATSNTTADPFPALYPAPTYPSGQCTWGVKRLVPWVGDWWGNGGKWAQSAQALGFDTGSEPRVGAIACWDDGSYGHVALVTHVDSPRAIQVKEANYMGQGDIRNYRGWFDPSHGWGQLTYIYPPGK